MPVVPHIVGQHLAGEALVGYELTDAALMRKPRLRLLGGAASAKKFESLSFAPARLNLLGKPILIEVSQSFLITANGGHLYLLAGKVRGREVALVPTDPEDFILIPTTEEDYVLIPTVEESWLLVPTTERSM